MEGEERKGEFEGGGETGRRRKKRRKMMGSSGEEGKGRIVAANIYQMLMWTRFCAECFTGGQVTLMTILY